MKTRKNLLTLLSLLCLTLLCITLLCLTFSGSDKAVESKTEISALQTATQDSVLANNDFDKKMEKWFVEFNQAQDKGLDMNKANAKAITAAGVEFESDDEKSQTLTANAEEATEQ
jgi:hypothetical protein